MFCTKCGKILNEGEVCTCTASTNDNNTEAVDVSAIKDMVTKVVESVIKTGNNDAFETGKQIVPDCINTNDGEIPIKQYDFAKLRSIGSLSFADGRLQVTNKRIIFRAAGTSVTGKTTIHQEFKIDDISGIDITKGQRFSFMHFMFLFIISGLGFFIGALIGGLFEGLGSIIGGILSVLIGFATVAGYFIFSFVLNKKNSHKKYFGLRQMVLFAVLGIDAILMVSSSGIAALSLFLVAILCAFNSIFLIFAPALTMTIMTSGGSPALKLDRKVYMMWPFPTKYEENSGFWQVLPWKDTDLAIKEVGAIIDDIKTMGDVAIGKWKN